MDNYIFGPVPSRRLGISLGIDVIPYKTCTLDCIYCECGRTTFHTTERSSFFPPEELISEFRKFIDNKIHLDYITFSGSGEPTLNSDIGFFINEIKQISKAPIAVLTNGTLLHLPAVQEDLMHSDLILPSLDAVSEEVFKKINRPAPGITSENIIAGLKSLSKKYKGEIWLEIFISKGINDSESELNKLRNAVEQINPDKIQLNSLDRPPAYKEAETADRELLEMIVDKWEGLPVEIIKRTATRKEISSFSKDLESSILQTISRRPLTIEDLMTLTGKKRLELLKYIDVLEKEKIIRSEIVDNKIFFRTGQKK